MNFYLSETNSTAASQEGPIIGPWIDPTTLGQLYSVKMRVLGLAFQPTNVDAAGPQGGWCITPGKPRPIGAGLVEYEDTYALLPPTRHQPESLSYPVQDILQISGKYTLVEIPITTTANVLYEYFHTTTPASISVLHTFRITAVTDTIWYTVGTPFAFTDPSIVAQDSTIRRLYGNIYERKTPYIAPINPSQKIPT